MDSLNIHTPQSEISRAFNNYFTLELKEKHGITRNKEDLMFKEVFPRTPHQKNCYDCGLFVLEYIERFLQAPDELFARACKQVISLERWFDSLSINTKRDKIRQIIFKLIPPDSAAKLKEALKR